MANTTEMQQSTETEPKEPAEMKEEPAAGKKELLEKHEETVAKQQPKELSDEKNKQSDKKPTELVDNKKADGKSKSEPGAEELAQKKKVQAAAQCDDFSKWVKEKCPSCPPIPRMFLYSIPVFITLPLLYRKFFCPPKCLRIGKCSKIYPGCCEPENRCNKPPCCNQR